MSAENNARPKNKSKVLQVLAWFAWTCFLLFFSGASLFAAAVRRDVYFVRHYEHHSMDRLTSAMTTHPVWLMLVPFVWLPFIISFQRRDNPVVGGLLLLVGSMSVAGLTIAILLLCSGPGIQM